MTSTEVTAAAGFERWYAAHHPRLLASMLLIAGDLDDASEATDEAFSRAYERWDRVQAMDSPGGWTYAVALNVLRRQARRRTFERRVLARHRPPTDIPPPAGEAWALVAELPLRQRTAVVLRYITDLTEPEVARVMGIRRGTVSAALTAARRSLARELDDRAMQEANDA